MRYAKRSPRGQSAETRRARRRLRLCAAVAGGTALLLLSACSGATQASSTSSVVTFAEQPGFPPNYIFPMLPASVNWPGNPVQFENLLYPPLYWFGQGSRPVLNKQLSVAYPPSYSDGNRTVTIRLKDYKWSDGVPVTSRDVEFWINLLKAGKDNYANYTPGDFPDNVASMSVPNSSTIVLHLTRAYNPTYYTFNNLSEVTPIPQQAWDKTSSSGPVGNYDETPAGAAKVFAFLTAESKNISTYATNPLWKVVDGPWLIKSFTTTGNVSFVPNRKYSGPDKPRLSAFEEESFTSETAELDALRAGDLDYGYLPIDDLSLETYFESHGYKVVPWDAWSAAFITINFTNPKTGPMFQQLYVRQAMQYLINQPQWIKAIWSGESYPTYGPVPTEPANSFVTSVERTNPYPYNPAQAISLLKAHGWTVRPNGVSTCSRAGSGAADCGAGIAAGTGLDFSLWVVANGAEETAEAEAMKSNFSAAGIEINVLTLPAARIGPDAHPCTTATPCHPLWDMIGMLGTIYSGEPTGEGFTTGDSANWGGYSSPTLDRLVQQTELSSSAKAFASYETYATENLPVLWLPANGPYQLTVIKSNLAGALPQDPMTFIDPSSWYYTK
jgi:peptide/nickel transport system substrate-binding protein